MITIVPRAAAAAVVIATAGVVLAVIWICEAAARAVAIVGSLVS